MAKKAATATELEVRNLPVGDIVPTPDNPRVIDEGCESFRGLLDSVKASGVLVPGHVRPHPTLKGKWDLRCGARRHRASVLAGRLTMPCVVHATCSDAEAFEITFVENFARQDLSPLEEGEAVRILLDRFQGDHAAVADKLGKTRQWVALRERLGQLSPAWRKAIGDSANAVARWGASNLALIARLDREVQDSALDTLSRDTRYNGERFAAAAAMRPGQLDQWLNDEYLHLLKSAAWKLDDATLEPTAGACTECPKRSSCQTNLFHDGELADKDAKKLDRCLDAACWQRKGDAMLARRYAELKAEHPKLQVLRGGGDYRAVEREAQAMLGRKDLSGIGWSSSFEKATEGEKGAFPAVVLDGKGKKAQVQWLKKVSHASTPSSRVPKTAEEKQAEVEHRRRARAIERLQAAIPGVELSEA
ncbi:MAG TPA: ParB/RepB/Spo0J family partition protein, partial [Planctomycetota bacterium]|nr:ParB/RepB/Spo0J family partition protein [Planctomycetota bacterium]